MASSLKLVLLEDLAILDSGKIDGRLATKSNRRSR